MPSEMLATLAAIRSGDVVSNAKLNEQDSFANAARQYVDYMIEQNLLGLERDVTAVSYKVDKSAYPCVRSIRRHPAQLEYMQLLKIYFPEAKKILILRDPRDVLVSFSEWKGQSTGSLLRYSPKSIYYFVRHIRNWFILNSRWVSDCAEDDNCFVLKYSEMKEDFEGSIDRVLKFLGLSSRQEFIDYLRDNFYKIDSDKYKEENEARGYGFFRKGEVGEWREKFKLAHRVIYLWMVLTRGRALKMLMSDL